MPGYTHLQRAQPVTLGHHLLAWVEMLDRDRAASRFAAAAGDAHPARRRRARRLDARARRAAAGDAQLARRRRRPRLRARLPVRVRRSLHPPLADRRGARPLGDRGVRLRAPARGGRDRLLDDAAEAEPRRRRARARQGRHGDRPAGRAARHAEGPPARLRPRPAGGQAAGLRGAPGRARRARGAARPRRRARARPRSPGGGCADPLLLATDAAETLVRAGVPFREAHERVAASVRDGTYRPPADVAPRYAPGPADVRAAVAEARRRLA